MAYKISMYISSAHAKTTDSKPWRKLYRKIKTWRVIVSFFYWVRGFRGRWLLICYQILKIFKVQNGGSNMAAEKHFISYPEEKLGKGVFGVADYESAIRFWKFQKYEMADPIWRLKKKFHFISWWKNYVRGFLGSLITNLLSDFEVFKKSKRDELLFFFFYWVRGF